MVIASFLDVGKRFFTQGRCLQRTPLHLIPPSHTTLKEETRREEGKRERESEIEETDNKTRTKFWRSMKLGVIYTPGFLRQRQAARRSHQVLSIVFLHNIDGQKLGAIYAPGFVLDNEKSHTTLKAKRGRGGGEREKEKETERERERRRNRENQRGETRLKL